jgi:uncharacterized membrane protein YfcA
MGIAKSDIQYSGSNLFKLVFFAFWGGWISGALGLGGGTIFNPLLLSMGLPPSVASATGMYMIIFSTGSSVTIYIIYNMLIVNLGLWISFWSTIGSVIGLMLMNRVLKRLNKQYPLVVLLSCVLGFSAIMVAIMGSIDMLKDYRKGKDIVSFKSIC